MVGPCGLPGIVPGRRDPPLLVRPASPAQEEGAQALRESPLPRGRKPLPPLQREVSPPLAAGTEGSLPPPVGKWYQAALSPVPEGVLPSSAAQAIPGRSIHKPSIFDDKTLRFSPSSLDFWGDILHNIKTRGLYHYPYYTKTKQEEQTCIL